MVIQSEQVREAEKLSWKIKYTAPDGFCRFNAALGKPSSQHGYWYPYQHHIKAFFRGVLDLFDSFEDLNTKLYAFNSKDPMSTQLPSYLTYKMAYLIVKDHLDSLNVTETELDNFFNADKTLKKDSDKAFYALYKRTWNDKFKRYSTSNHEQKIFLSYLNVGFFEKMIHASEKHRFDNCHCRFCSVKFSLLDNRTILDHPLYKIKEMFAYTGPNEHLAKEIEAIADQQNRPIKIPEEVYRYSMNRTNFIVTDGNHTSHVTVENLTPALLDCLKNTSTKDALIALEKHYLPRKRQSPPSTPNPIMRKNAEATPLLQSLRNPKKLAIDLATTSIETVLNEVLPYINPQENIKLMDRTELQSHYDHYKTALRTLPSEESKTVSHLTPQNIKDPRPPKKLSDELSHEAACVQKLSESIGTFFSKETLIKMERNPDFNKIIEKNDVLLATLLQAEEYESTQQKP